MLACILALAVPCLALPIHDASAAASRHLARRQAATIPGLDFPAGQTALTVPEGAYLNSIQVGVGFQNYTCSAAGTFATNQAIARLYDAFDLINTDALVKAPALALAAFTAAGADPAALFTDGSAADAAALAAAPTLNHVGDHFFVPSPVAGATGTSPRFHVVDGLSGQDEFTIGNKTASIPSSDGATNVAWVQLANIATDGTLATTFYRTHTAGGVPDATCDPADTSVKSVPYAALYAFLI